MKRIIYLEKHYYVTYYNKAFIRFPKKQKMYSQYFDKLNSGRFFICSRTDLGDVFARK